MSSTDPRRTALDALHRSLGATMTDFAGWDMPLRYGSERDEHIAVRTGAGLFDLSHMGEVTVSGPQSAALLNYALVGDIASVAVGRARYTMICRADGGILDDLIVYRLEEGEAGSCRYMVVANASNAQVVLDALTERAAGFDAAVRDDRDAYALLAVQGPESLGILRSLSARLSTSLEQGGAPVTDLDGLKYYTGLHGRGRPGPDRTHRLHRRGRLRVVRRPGRRGEAVAGADRGGLPGGTGPVRPLLPGHPAPGGGHAAVRA